MRYLTVCFIVVIFISGSALAQNSDLPRKKELHWYFGQGLTAGDEFVFEICDYALRLQSTSPCYVATLSFVTLLPSNQEEVWIVSAHVNHGTANHDMILHHTKTTHLIRTDVANILYADSLQRTLGWINGFASEHRPQVLDVGKSWGKVTSMAEPVYLIVNRVEQTDDEEQTYVLGYGLVKNSYLQIRPGFPFPLKAKVYKPVFLQEQPLSFAFQLLSHRSTLKMCNVSPSKAGDFSYQIVAEQEKPQIAITNGTSTLEFSYDVQKIDEDVMKLLKERHGQRYMQKMEQAAHNFTKLIEIISEVMDSPDLNMTEPN